MRWICCLRAAMPLWALLRACHGALLVLVVLRDIPATVHLHTLLAAQLPVPYARRAWSTPHSPYADTLFTDTICLMSCISGHGQEGLLLCNNLARSHPAGGGCRCRAWRRRHPGGGRRGGCAGAGAEAAPAVAGAAVCLIACTMSAVLAYAGARGAELLHCCLHANLLNRLQL